MVTLLPLSLFSEGYFCAFKTTQCTYVNLIQVKQVRCVCKRETFIRNDASTE